MTSAMRYSTPAIVLHWLVALLIFVAFPLGLYMADLPLSPEKLKLISYHKWIGVTVFMLAGLRVVWRLAAPCECRRTWPAVFADSGDSDFGLADELCQGHPDRVVRRIAVA